MDLNFLYFHHQLSVMQSASAPSCLARTRCLAAAEALANRIQIYQAAKGALAAPGWLRAIEPSERSVSIQAGISV